MVRGSLLFGSGVKTCHLLPRLHDGAAIVRMQPPDFVVDEAMVNRDELRQSDCGRARQTDFRPAFHRHVGRFARRMRGEARDEQIHFAADQHKAGTTLVSLKI
jgi:hypothetical protein